MTREEAIRMLNAKLECMTRDVSGCDDDCNNKRCDECHLCYEQGTTGEQKECLRMAIKALDVLDKIKRDIFNACSDNYHMPVNKLDCDEIFEIIDKCKAESEE